MDNRFYLVALGITGVFIALLVLIWIASGGKAASDAEIQNANNTRTAIAMTGSYLLQPRTRTPPPSFATPSPVSQTNVPASTSTSAVLPSVTNTSLFPVFSTPTAPLAPSLTPLPTQTAVAQVPVSTITLPPGHPNTKSAPLIPPSGTQGTVQDPAGFVRWYFARAVTERDYQNLWDNYLTASFKTNVGSGLFDDYVWWWNTVQSVDINSIDVPQNNGQDAAVRVNLTFHMKDGRLVENQVYNYDLLYDPSRATWMFDASP